MGMPLGEFVFGLGLFEGTSGAVFVRLPFNGNAPGATTAQRKTMLSSTTHVSGTGEAQDCGMVQRIRVISNGSIITTVPMV